LAILLRRWWIILGLPLLFGVVAYLNSDSGEVSYEASSKLLLRNVAPLPPAEETETELPPEGAEGEAAQEPEGPQTLNEFLTSERIVSTYANLVYRRDVLDRVVGSLSLPYDAAALREKIEVSPVGDTQLIDVTVTDSDAERAAAVANEVATAFVSVVESEIGVAGTVLVAEQATPPSAALTVDTSTAVVLAVTAGLLLAVLLVVLLEHLDDTVRTPAEAEAVTSLPILGVIGRNRRAGRIYPGELPIGEDYRDLRASIRALKDRNGLQTVLIAGHGRKEGRSLTAFSLGLMLAEAGESVVVVDADLRQPSLHKIANVSNKSGLSTLLTESGRKLDVPASLVNSNLELITAGPPVVNPSVIASIKMAELLDELAYGTDFVILDSPALSGVSDASDLARIVDGTVLVIEAGRTHASALRSTVAMLEQRGAQLLGVIVNKGKSPRRQGKAYRARGAGRQMVAITPRKAVKEAFDPASPRQELAGSVVLSTRNGGSPSSHYSAAGNGEKEEKRQLGRHVTPFSKVRQRLNGVSGDSHAESDGARLGPKAGLSNNSERTG
jgi:capsular exopolysaccharide synthesis family protein